MLFQMRSPVKMKFELLCTDYGRGRAAGPSRMKVESLLGWETSNPEAWKLLVGIVQESFLGFEVPTAYSQAIFGSYPQVGSWFSWCYTPGSLVQALGDDCFTAVLRR